MFIIYGTRTMRIKKYIDTHVKCEECGSYTHIFKVYHDYFHIFFIPFVPTGVKRVTSYCHKCGSQWNGEKRDFYLEQTRKPKYLYAGVFLIVALLGLFVFMGVRSDRLEKEYIANPAIGDIYFIKDEEEVKGYYFMKIKHIHADSVFFVFNAYVYNGYVSRFDSKDFFNLANNIWLLKDELKDIHEKGIIRSVKRNYNARTGFHIEKIVELKETESQNHSAE